CIAVHHMALSLKPGRENAEERGRLAHRGAEMVRMEVVAGVVAAKSVHGFAGSHKRKRGYGLWWGKGIWVTGGREEKAERW
ncbi:hypothetical protein Ancab_003883, partial [Ancistrocladus abbreviatus]